MNFKEARREVARNGDVFIYSEAYVKTTEFLCLDRALREIDDELADLYRRRVDILAQREAATSEMYDALLQHYGSEASVPEVLTFSDELIFIEFDEDGPRVRALTPAVYCDLYRIDRLGAAAAPTDSADPA